MHAQELIATLAARGIRLIPDRTGLVVTPASKLTDADRQAIRAHKAELLRLLLLDRIEAIWKPGEWLAYHDGGVLLTAKYAGTSTNGRVNVWLADGAVRAVPADTVALEWCPDAAEIFEGRLILMLAAGVPEDVARPRAARCTREYLDGLQGGAA